MPRITAELVAREFPEAVRTVGEPVEREEVDWRRGPSGEVLKVTRRVRVTRKAVRENAAVAARRAWAKFGQCKGRGAGPEAGITEVGDDVCLEVPEERRTAADHAEAQRAAAIAAATVRAAVTDIRCRICGEAHWTSSCPLRATAKGQEILAAAERGADGAAGAAPSAGGPGKYVVPGKRAGAPSEGSSAAGGGGRFGDRFGRRERDDTATLRVSNLTENAQEDDLRDLFGRFGALQRVFVARDQSDGHPRGYAFVNYYDRDDAKKALEALNGFGYDHLILSVEWAAPSRK